MRFSILKEEILNEFERKIYMPFLTFNPFAIYLERRIIFSDDYSGKW